MDGSRSVNNPDRVPSTLDVIDGPQEGAPRLIHPIILMVGTTERTRPMGIVTTMDAEHQYEVPEDGTYFNDMGDPFQFPKGHSLPLAVAIKFPDFRSELGDEQVPGTANARQEPAPENRTETAAQRKAREKAEKEAAAKQAAEAEAREKAEARAKAEADASQGEGG